MATQDVSIEYPSLDLLYAETRDRVIRQGNTIDHVNTKTSIVLGVDAVVLAALLALPEDMMTAQASSASVLSALAYVLAHISAVSCLVSLICCLVAYRPVTYKEVLEPRGAYECLIYKPAAESKHELLTTMICSYEATRDAIGRNLRWFRASLWSLGVAAVLALSAWSYYLGA